LRKLRPKFLGRLSPLFMLMFVGQDVADTKRRMQDRYLRRQVLKKYASALDTIGKGLLVGSGLLGLGVMAHDLISYFRARRSADRLMHLMAEKDPVLSQVDRRELEQYLRLLLDVSPELAANPMLLRAVLRQMATYEGADPGALLHLSDLASQMGYRPLRTRLIDTHRLMADVGRNLVE